MTQEQKRIKLAEVRGVHVCPDCWREIDPELCHCGDFISAHGFDSGHGPIPWGCTCGYNDAKDRKSVAPQCPDYFNDLNACHQFELWMRGTDEEYWNDFKRQNRWRVYQQVVYSKFGISATAAQRAETLGLLLKLWKAPEETEEERVEQLLKFT